MGAFLRLDVAGVFGIVVGQNREFNRKSNMYSNQIGNVILKIVYLKKNIMKKLLYLFIAIIFIGCSENEKEEDCNCTKTSYVSDFPTGSSNNIRVRKLSTENVPCQDEETRVTTSSDSSGSTNYYYKICCSNLDNSLAGIGCDD